MGRKGEGEGEGWGLQSSKCVVVWEVTAGVVVLSV